MKRSVEACLILMLFCDASFAVLGERQTASLTGVNAKAAIIPNTTIRYQVQNDNSVTIKEFIGADGVVYAITWQGPRAPNLQELLGQYFPEYALAAATTPHRIARRRLTATSSNLKISQFGLPGAISGIIYLKDRLPTNVQPEDLK